MVKSCVECLGEFPEDELLAYGEHVVCLACKETLLDKLKMGSPIGRGPWVLGSSMLVIPKRIGTLPKICLKCGESSTREIPLPKSPITAPLCLLHFERCQKWRRVNQFAPILIPLILVLISASPILLPVVAIADARSILLIEIFASVALVVTVAATIIVDRAAKSKITVVRADEDHLYVANAGKEYLKTLLQFKHPASK